MASDYLTKSDFLTARSCPSKLYYKKHKYPNTLIEDEYLEMLADGGYMVGKLAQLLYPDGISITGELDEANDETWKHLQKNRVTLFEPVLLSNGKLVRVDILQKTGERYRIIEVKSKSFNSSDFREKGPAYFGKPEWRKYLEDVAYQKLVAAECFGDVGIEACLLLPDKAKKAAFDGMIGWFSLEKSGDKKGRTQREVHFHGNAEEAQASNILSLVNVDEFLDDIIDEISGVVPCYLKSLERDQRIEVQISASCKGCEYAPRDGEHVQSGFKTCWGDMAETKPHILELSNLGNFNRRDEINELIQAGKSALQDIPPELLEGKYQNRSFYQRTCTEEFLKPEFQKESLEIEYPLHFIDFETSQMAIPSHRDMRPYEKVLFQWSCHTISRPKGDPEHKEWINTEDTCPNVEFGKSLMSCIGNSGTIMTWSNYENTQLKSLYCFLAEHRINEPELVQWLTGAAKLNKNDDSRIFDMEVAAKHFYFHPFMGGRTSIKVVLPAVLKATRSDRITNLLSMDGLYARDDSGCIVDPYELLPKIEILNKSEQINEGTGAMRAYQELMYGPAKDDTEARSGYRDALLRYCKLDTLAMVLIWEHWTELSFAI